MSERVEQFEDLIAWQKARDLARKVYEVTKQGSFSKDFGLSGQIQRAAVSVMSNVAEGFERGGRAEFHQFLSVAKASCAEVRSHLYLAFDIGYLRQNEFHELLDIAKEVTRIIGGLRAAVERQKSRQRGIQQLSPQPSPFSP
jgi:four helix bundle protein